MENKMRTLRNKNGSTMHIVTAKLQRLGLVGLLTLCLILGFELVIPSNNAEAGSRVSQCGGNSQRPCNLWEAFPSCDSGLAQNFIKNKCGTDVIGNFVETTVEKTSDTMEKGLQAAKTAIESAAVSVYKGAAELAFQQMGTPMKNMVAAWKTLIASEPTKYQRLVNAIRNKNGSETQTALEDVLVSLYTYAGFAGIVQDFKDKNAGSLLLIVSAGVGAAVTLEGDIGLAIDIDYLIHLATRVANGHNSSTFSGAIGSLFTAVGIQVGPAAGGGVDLVVGYHLSNPDGVYGPGLDISLEIKSGIGGGIGFSYDLSQAPWQIVMGGIGVGAGVEVQLSIGPSYAVVLGQLCANGSLKAFANQCSSSNDLSGEYQIRVKATNTFWHEDGCCSKLVSTRWQPNDDFTRFILEIQSDGSYRIKVKANNRYLHVDSSSDKILSTRYQSNDDFTRFFFEKQSDGSYRIKLKATNRYLHQDESSDKMLSTRWQSNDDFTRFFLDKEL